MIKGGRCVWSTILPPSFADIPKILGASKSWRPQGLPGLSQGYLYLNVHIVGFRGTTNKVQACRRTFLPLISRYLNY